MNRRGMALVGSMSLGAAIVVGIAMHAHPGPWPIDQRWADLMARTRGPALTFVAEQVFNRLGRFPVSWLIVAVAALALRRAGRTSAIAVLLIGEIASWATNSLLKFLVGRPRPPGALIQPPASSYPSGHAAFAAVTAVLVVVLLAPRGRRVGWALVGAVGAIGMAWSRTYLGVHWLTDVVGGLAVGAGVALLTLTLSGGREALRTAVGRG